MTKNFNKNNIFKLSYFLILGLIMVSCASKNKHHFDNQASEDLAKSFDLSNKEFDKFKVIKIDSKKVTTNSQKKKVEKKIKKNFQKTKKLKSQKKKSGKKKKEEIAGSFEGKADTKSAREKLVSEKNSQVEQLDSEQLNSESEKSSLQYKIDNNFFPEDYPKIFHDYDRVSEKIWDTFFPNVYIGEEQIFKISFLGLTVGALRLKTHDLVQIDNKKVFHFSGTMRSANYYSMIYKLDDTINNYIEAEKFLPLKYTLIQRESGQSVDDLQLFDWEKNQTFFWYKKIKNEKTTKKTKNSYIPTYIQDIFSSLYFVRSLPLKTGDSYTFPIVMRAKVWVIKMNIVRIEEVKILGAWQDAFRIEAKAHLPGDKKRKGSVVFWYSKDSLKKLLKFEAKVKIGNVSGEMIDYKEGRKY